MNMLRKIILALLIINIILNAILLYSEYSGNDFCITANNSCGNVQNSQYGELFGIKLAYLGLPIFILLLIIFAAAQYNKMFDYFFVFATLIGGIFASYFLGIQYLVLNQTCSNCLVIDNIAIIIFVLAFVDFLKQKR